MSPVRRSPALLARPSIAAAALTLALVWSPVAGARQAPVVADPPAERVAAVPALDANALRSHIAFLASDLLEGRDTPSPGLDVAAEYIAAQFRRAGLEPIGTDGYFQVAPYEVEEPDAGSFRLDLSYDGKEYRPGLDRVSFNRFRELDLVDLPLVRVNAAEPGAVPDDLDVKGKAVVLVRPAVAEGPEAEAAAEKARGLVLAKLTSQAPGLILDVDGSTDRGTGLPRGRLVDPERRGVGLGRFVQDRPGSPVITLHDPALAALLGQAPSLTGLPGKLTVRLGAPVTKPVKLKNVAGLIRGSDPALADTYVIVSAHYDHVGVGGRPGEPDRIFNGANDDASGTAAVMELARVLAAVQPAPKRSILFLTFFGEEKGLVGSRYYGRHPLVPIAKTVAHVNLEQVGRTDDSEGPMVNRASMTGFDFSDVGTSFARAGALTGVEVFKHPRNSDAFFARSDNQALADEGVPAHTLCVAFMYPDYHKAADHWDKIDYDNLARVGRAFGLGLLLIADSPTAPAWNRENTKTKRYVEAWERYHPPAK